MSDQLGEAGKASFLDFFSSSYHNQLGKSAKIKRWGSSKSEKSAENYRYKVGKHLQPKPSRFSVSPNRRPVSSRRLSALLASSNLTYPEIPGYRSKMTSYHLLTGRYDAKPLDSKEWTNILEMSPDVGKQAIRTKNADCKFGGIRGDYKRPTRRKTKSVFKDIMSYEENDYFETPSMERRKILLLEAAGDQPCKICCPQCNMNIMTEVCAEKTKPKRKVAKDTRKGKKRGKTNEPIGFLAWHSSTP